MKNPINAIDYVAYLYILIHIKLSWLIVEVRRGMRRFGKENRS